MSKLIAETGQCKMKGFSYTVHIYATNGGVCGSLIFGAYKDNNRVWKQATWNKDGTHIHNMASLSLVPMPPSQYFNIYTDADGVIEKIGMCRRDLKSAMDAQLNTKATTYKYTNGVIYKYTDSLIEKVEEE